MDKSFSNIEITQCTSVFFTVIITFPNDIIVRFTVILLTYQISKFKPCAHFVNAVLLANSARPPPLLVKQTDGEMNTKIDRVSFDTGVGA